MKAGLAKISKKKRIQT